MMSKKLVLASQSPRRQAFLSQLGYEFDVLAADIDESPLANEIPADYVQRLATQKAQHCFALLSQSSDSLVIGSDTCVVCQGKILGKPKDEADCIATLTLLSGKTHQVLTAVALVADGLTVAQLVSTEVTFRRLTLAEMQRYWQTGEPQDKAGSYAIQGLAGQFITSISGSYSSVVGLPLVETKALLTQAGLTAQMPIN